MTEIGTVGLSPSMRHVTLRIVVPRSFKVRLWIGSRLAVLAARVMGAQARIEIE
jgi:hypothetical protein